MRSALWQFARVFLVGLSLAAFALPKNGVAQASQHLVSPSDLQQATVDASQSRQQNIDTLNNFFSTDQARQAMQSAHVNPQEVKNAVAGLSDQELAQLASRAQKAQNDFAAGNMTNYDLLIIVIILVAIILVVVAVR